MVMSARMSKPALDIVAAMNSKLLFANWFKGSSWDNWHTVLKGAFALPMSEAERAFFRTVAERDPPTKPVRELWCVIGRSGGKDSIASLVTAHAAALFDRRDHLPNPAEAHRCWRGERSKPVRLGVRDHHTRSLCTQSPAQTEQWCCWLCRRRIIFDRKRSRPIRAFSATPHDGHARAERLLKIPAEPSCISPALQLKREWSPWPEFGSDPGNPRELSKG